MVLDAQGNNLRQPGRDMWHLRSHLTYTESEFAWICTWDPSKIHILVSTPAHGSLFRCSNRAMCGLTSHRLLMLSCHQDIAQNRKSRPGSTHEMVEFGDTLKMKTLQRHFAHPKSRPRIVFYQASSVPIVNQAVISLIPGFKVIGMCMGHIHHNCSGKTVG